MCFRRNLKVTITSLLLFSILSIKIYAQIDELKEKLNSAKGEEKAAVLNEFALMYLRFGESRNTTYYAFEAWKEAQKYDNKKQIGIALQYLGNAYANMSQIDSAMFFQEKAIVIRLQIKDKQGLAKSYNSMGSINLSISEYKESIKYYTKAFDIKAQLGDSIGMGISLNSIGKVYFRLGSYNEAIDHFQRASNVFEDIGYENGIAACLNDIGLVYENYEHFDKAIDFYNEALAIYEKEGNLAEMASSYNNVGVLYSKHKEYDTSIMYHQRALETRIKLNDKPGTAASYNNIGTSNLEKAKYIKNEREKRKVLRDALVNFEKALTISEEINKKNEMCTNLLAISMAYQHLGDFEKALETLDRSRQISEEINLKEMTYLIYEVYSEIYDTMGRFKESIKYYRLYMKEWKEIYQAGTRDQFAEMAAKYETDKQQKELKIQDLELTKNEEVIKRQKMLRNSFIAGLVLLLIVAFVIFRSLQQKKRDNKIIEAEKEKSEKLLLNTLPAKVVAELKEKGKTDPESFDNVSVYFSDVVGFTNMSTNLEPKLLISELNDIFTAFDDIMVDNQCERLKTIGDAYLAVCGMPEANKDHAELMLKSAMKIVDYLDERNSKSELLWRIRIGLHTGKVVGGVVGVRKYIYDVFGDTINTASRMESNSEPMRINVSEAYHELLKNKYKFTAREIKEVKGKGRMIMFFLDTDQNN